MKVSRPTAIHGRRQIGTTARRRRAGSGTAAQARSASSSQRGRSSRQAASIRASEPNAPSSGADVGDVHGDARRAQRVQVGPPVLLLVGQHQVRRQLDDPVQVRVLGAAHPHHVQIGRMGAPVGRADQQAGRARGHRLGQRRHDRHHPLDPRGRHRRPRRPPSPDLPPRLASGRSHRLPTAVRAIEAGAGAGSHVPPVLAADLEERVRQLAQRADPGRPHQLVEHVALAGGHVLQPADGRLGLARVPGLEVGQPGQLALLLRLGGPGQLDLLRGRRPSPA